MSIVLIWSKQRSKWPMTWLEFVTWYVACVAWNLALRAQGWKPGLIGTPEAELQKLTDGVTEVWVDEVNFRCYIWALHAVIKRQIFCIYICSFCSFSTKFYVISILALVRRLCLIVWMPDFHVYVRMPEFIQIRLPSGVITSYRFSKWQRWNGRFRFWWRHSFEELKSMIIFIHHILVET